MSEHAVSAVRALVGDTIELCDSLTRNEWVADTGCAGWRVQDVIAHLAGFFVLLADPSAAPPLTPADSAEERNEELLANRRGWRPEDVLAEYRAVSSVGLEILGKLQAPKLSKVPVCMGDIGTYPLPALAEAACFDHLCHLLHDLAAPRGPLARLTIPRDPLRLSPTLDWMLRGVPQMSGSALSAALTEAVDLSLEGAAARRVRLAAGPDGLAVISPVDSVGGNGPAVTTVTTVTTDGVDFLAWATRRADWRPLVRVCGDEALAERVLNSLRVV
jgi:hypothetical protein